MNPKVTFNIERLFSKTTFPQLHITLNTRTFPSLNRSSIGGLVMSLSLVEELYKLNHLFFKQKGTPTVLYFGDLQINHTYNRNPQVPQDITKWIHPTSNVQPTSSKFLINGVGPSLTIELFNADSSPPNIPTQHLLSFSNSLGLGVVFLADGFGLTYLQLTEEPKLHESFVKTLDFANCSLSSLAEFESLS